MLITLNKDDRKYHSLKALPVRSVRAKTILTSKTVNTRGSRDAVMQTIWRCDETMFVRRQTPKTTTTTSALIFLQPFRVVLSVVWKPVDSASIKNVLCQFQYQHIRSQQIVNTLILNSYRLGALNILMLRTEWTSLSPLTQHESYHYAIVPS
jgi:hypothetical protein